MNQSNIATQFFIDQEMRKYSTRMGMVLQQIGAADSVRDLVRAYGDTSHAASSTIRVLVRSTPEMRRCEALAVERGGEMIEDAMRRLAEFRRTPEKQFRAAAGRLIESMREPCRGHLSALCHRFDHELQKITTWRHHHLKTEEDAVPRPQAGESLMELGYVFHQTNRRSLPQILEEGLTAGSFSRKPIEFGGEVWLGVHPRHLPAYQEHDYAGVQALEPGWDPLKKYDYDDDMKSIERLVHQVVPAELLVLSDGNGMVLKDGTLHSQMRASQVSSRRPRPL